MAERQVQNPCLAEYRRLADVKEALQVSLDWPVAPPGIGRKLSTVRFTARSLKRHLERLMNLEEDGGYMVLVGELKPNLFDQTMRLRRQHDELRATLERVVPAFEEIDEHKTEPFERLCNELRGVLKVVEEHDARETALWQEAFCTDDGGEG